MIHIIRYQKIYFLFIINKYLIFYIILVNSMNNQNVIFQELIKNQRKNLDVSKQLKLSDFKRISGYLQTSIFTDKCSFWTGYITKFGNNKFYINFFFNNKKTALHRLLYYNFINSFIIYIFTVINIR